ncbi:hypothetical protein Tsubulata_031728 [Turnera subulata]|uniref:Endonuclease/exonuclease/phosphatase domain-containing protein n=1 Tax=Turnera subulata TaxID=218843 RepID=A0A9Q0FER4_9ROSI|nr:hypothetical protein Tsubulata_031728 [Turnera subulata]
MHLHAKPVSNSNGVQSGDDVMEVQDEMTSVDPICLKRKVTIPLVSAASTAVPIEAGIPKQFRKANSPLMDSGGTGARSNLFSSSFRDLVQQHRVHLAVILEPRISGVTADRVIRTLGFQGWVREDARGFVGGIWVLWHPDVLSVSVVQRCDQFLHVQVSPHGKPSFFLTAVYTSTSESRQSSLWPRLLFISERMQDPWLLMGDFNVTAFPEETQGGAGVQFNRLARFREWISDCHLTDLGFKGPRFTWFRGLIRRRLDRMLANDQWRARFDDASVFHLLRVKSDHRPLLLKKVADS